MTHHGEAAALAAPAVEPTPRSSSAPVRAVRHARDLKDARARARASDAEGSGISAQPTGPTWQMPVVPAMFDRSPILTVEEQEILAAYPLQGGPGTGWAPNAIRARRTLTRLEAPILAVSALYADPAGATHLRRFLYTAMARDVLAWRAQPPAAPALAGGDGGRPADEEGEVDPRGPTARTFWAWSPAEWAVVLHPSPAAFVQSYGVGSYVRAKLLTFAYLLGDVRDVRGVGGRDLCKHLAYRLFGVERLHAAADRVLQVLAQRWGFSTQASVTDATRTALAQVFLLQRSPHLEAVTAEVVQEALGDCGCRTTHDALLRVGMALDALGLLTWPHPARPPVGSRPPVATPALTDAIAPTWVAWCDAWYAQVPSLGGRRTRYVTRVHRAMLAVGRWLAHTHPEVTAPDQWDADLALEYVQSMCESRIGDDASPYGRRCVQGRGTYGATHRPAGIASRLICLRRFFSDLQDRPHRVSGAPARTIPVRFKPRQVFALPGALYRFIQPDPRTIDLAFWYALTSAAATLSQDDLSAYMPYPLSLYRALALLWVTSARRANELVRLRLGCVRREWDPQMCGEDGTRVEPESDGDLCYLHIPPNKTRGAFWIPIPTYTADAIAAWERERPAEQASFVDGKDGAVVQLLFCYRNRRVSPLFLNESLIPLLCRKQGIPLADARGRITSHRARSTIATLLRRSGVSLEDIAEFLGHQDTKTVTAYARTDPYQFARALKKANDLEREVQGLLDPHAAADGQPSVFYFLGRGPDNAPRYCGNPFWVDCPHRLACLKCSMYVGGTAAERLEVRDHLIPFHATVRMTALERAAVEGDMERLDEQLALQRQVPVPVPPSPAYVFNPLSLSTSPASSPASLAAQVPVCGSCSACSSCSACAACSPSSACPSDTAPAARHHETIPADACPKPVHDMGRQEAGGERKEG